MNRESFDFEKVDFLTWSTKKSKELLIILESKIKNVLSFVDLSVLQKNEFEEIKRNYRNRFIYSLWNIHQCKTVRIVSRAIFLHNDLVKKARGTICCYGKQNKDTYQDQKHSVLF